MSNLGSTDRGTGLGPVPLSRSQVAHGGFSPWFFIFGTITMNLRRDFPLHIQKRE